MPVLYIPRRTVVRAPSPFLGQLAVFAALLFLGATFYAAAVPIWTEAGLRAELNRTFHPGATSGEVDFWFMANRAISHAANHGAEIHGLVYAGPIIDRERNQFHVLVHLDHDRVTGCDVSAERP
jgi:hypothetical protein